jgi:hypothetical protein
MKILPTFKGWTVDQRLREFRKVEFKRGSPSIQFAPFNTLKGKMLLKSYIHHKSGSN